MTRMKELFESYDSITSTIFEIISDANHEYNEENGELLFDSKVMTDNQFDELMDAIKRELRKKSYNYLHDEIDEWVEALEEIKEDLFNI